MTAPIQTYQSPQIYIFQHVVDTREPERNLRMSLEIPLLQPRRTLDYPLSTCEKVAYVIIQIRSLQMEAFIQTNATFPPINQTFSRRSVILTNLLDNPITQKIDLSPKSLDNPITRSELKTEAFKKMLE